MTRWLLVVLALTALAGAQRVGGGGSGNATSLQGKPVATTAPASGNCLVFTTSWGPGSCSGTSSTNWSALVSGTNTTGVFLIGTGASLGTSGTGTISANTAAALAATPAQCAGGQFATGIAASGAANCATPAGGSAATAYTWGQRAGNGWGLGGPGQVRVIGLSLPAAVKFSAITFQVVTADTTGGDVYDIGIYCFTGNASCTAGALLADIGPVALATTGDFTASLKQGTVTLQAGQYLWAFTGNATTATPDEGSLSTSCNFVSNGAAGASSSGGQLPASAGTLPTAAWSCSDTIGYGALHQ